MVDWYVHVLNAKHLPLLIKSIPYYNQSTVLILEYQSSTLPAPRPIPTGLHCSDLFCNLVVLMIQSRRYKY